MSKVIIWKLKELRLKRAEKGSRREKKVTGGQKKEPFVDNDRIDSIQKAFERARHGRNLFGLKDAQ